MKEPAISAAFDQTAAAAMEWASHLMRYRLQLVMLGFSTETAELLVVALDERCGPYTQRPEE